MMAPTTETQDPLSIAYDEGLQPVYPSQAAAQAPEVVTAYNQGISEAPQYVDDQGERELYNQDLHFNFPHAGDPPEKLKPSFWRRKTIIIVLIVVAAIIAIIIGITVSQTRKNSTKKIIGHLPLSFNSSTPGNDGATPPPNYFSTYGAYNGTSLSTTDPLTGDEQGQLGNLLLFFQHHTGDLRYSELVDSMWQGGGSDFSLGVKNAANATPIAGVSYQTIDGSAKAVATWTVFYLDDSSTIQNVVRDNITNQWTSGSIGNFNFKAPKSSHVALTVCFSADWYGLTVGESGGLRLYAAGEDGLIHEYSWYLGNETSWQEEFAFQNSNGFAGAACWPAGGITNLYLQDSTGGLKTWWKDFNTNATNTTQHPLSVWQRGPDAATEDRSNSSIAFSNNAYFQDDDNQVFGIAAVNGSENFEWGASFSVDGVQAMLGTSIACQTFFPSETGPSGLYIYFQTNGTNVVEYVRAQEGGPWSMNYIPVD